MKKIAFLLLLTMVGCASRQKQVWLTELKDAHNTDRKDVARVYLDKKGCLYPEKNFYIPYKSFFKESQYKSTYKFKPDTGNLKSYFTDSIAEAKKLATSYGIASNQEAGAIFTQVQAKIQSDKISEIQQLLNASSSKTLLILIHGFNDPNPSGDYQRMRDYIKTYKAGKDYIYLEVYWDGLTSNQGNPGTSKIWGAAQLNSSYEANAVRHLINGLSSTTKVRIITHSLGASVGTGALFNTFSKWKCPKEFDYYGDMMSTPAPSQSDIRIGMIAPAIPGVATFVDFNQRKDTRVNTTDTILPSKNNINTVVVGYKKTDYALYKGFMKKKRFLSKIAGATTLGSNAATDGVSEIDRVTKTILALGYTPATNPIKAIDFEANTHFDKEHGLYYYMQNDQKLKQFLDKLLD